MISDRPYRRALPMSTPARKFGAVPAASLIPSRRCLYVHPEQHWLELRENLGSPFRLAHLKNLQV